MNALIWFTAGFVAEPILVSLVSFARWSGDKTGRFIGRWLRRKMDGQKP